ncbi:uncharacterized protein TRIADDRAFT_51991 [Trichoplax adhaerens]|uniref:EF-hand domain-containing protein n=1 Tax=Trichoplax adhaerens TaxID=10228 RepID=B3RLG4_TRIAD|nr:hypothetical protein TRIADDRAFT_51991 [Trichoplax adhaerens]EDV28768.1 hypothetical protein TRIADDRAFT_51991 [Trichoplax adhaerens]|eukprot:XP_002107970.1 hypothetical protein TRIADDRAFT_51991 [Trichoplax adhaerens]
MEAYRNSTDKDHSTQLARSLFDVCDVAQQGYIQRCDLEILCQKKVIPISVDEAHQLFYLLDENGDGIVTIEEFMSCFEDAIGIAMPKNRNQETLTPPLSSPESTTHYEHENTYTNDYLEFFHNQFFEGQDQLCELFQQLNESDSPQLLVNLESFLLCVVKDIKRRQENTEQLELALKRSTEKQAEHIHQLEEEFDLQLSKAEAKIRAEERNKTERVISGLRCDLEGKQSELQEITVKIQAENRALKSQITSAQTELSIVRSDMSQLNNDYEEQSLALQNESETVLVHVREQENLTRQLQTLREANRKLQMVNIDLKERLEVAKGSSKPNGAINDGKLPNGSSKETMSFKDECASQGIDSDSYRKNATLSQISVDLDDRPLTGNGGIRSNTADSSDIFQANGDAKPEKKLFRTDSHYNIGKMEVNKTDTKMFKLVLAGDAAVGKSSFILRLCQNRFHNALHSTLGVDFQMKTLEVDGIIVTLQLWDTAGQERYRSIAKSYFRKVDGVLLLYDVTSESSFLNVRDWMDAIENSTSKPVPIMLLGNKVDLRDTEEAKGEAVISTENGQRLAKEYQAMFVECSAKSGVNVSDACLKLTRILMENESKSEGSSNGMKLTEKTLGQGKKFGCCHHR